MALALDLTASYDKTNDTITCFVFKQNNGVAQPITAGTVSLLQAGEVINSIPIDNRVQYVRFIHPPGLANLTVSASIDSLNQTTTVNELAPLESMADWSLQPPPGEVMEVEPPVNTIVDPSEFKEPTLLSLDFNVDPLPVTYQGGNRIIFDYNNTLVQQPLNQLPVAPKFSEIATTNLIGAVELLSLFSVSATNSALNALTTNTFGLTSLQINHLGGSKNQVNTGTTVTVALASPVTNGVTHQFYFGLSKQPSIAQFQLVTQILNNSGGVIATNTQNLNTANFVNNLGLISETLNAIGNLTFSLIFPNMSASDIFNMDILLPQVTALEFVTSYTPNTRTPDVYTTAVSVNTDYTTIEINANASGQPGVLFDMNTVKAHYDGTNLIFSVGSTSIQGDVDITQHSDFQFIIDKADNQLTITVDDVTLIQGGAGFVLVPPTSANIGCDINGANQINGQINSFSVTQL